MKALPSSKGEREVKRVLVIAYAFPPCGGAGVQRTAKFVQYLPNFGWLPTVDTVVESCYGVKDSSEYTLPGNVEIVRTVHLDPVARFARLSTPASQNGSNETRAVDRASFVKAMRALARKS